MSVPSTPTTSAAAPHHAGLQPAASLTGPDGRPWSAPADILALAPERLPHHIAVIMDGNGRWAQRQGQPRVFGHHRGARVVEDLVGECCRLLQCTGAPRYLTLYSFSLENWKRPASEIDFLMRMYVDFLRTERDKLMRENVRFNQIGRSENLPAEVLEEVDRTLEMTRGNDGLVVTLALNYGSRGEITDAARQIAREVAEGRLRPDEVDEQAISDRLYTAGRAARGPNGVAMPDVDLLVRTAGELRLSNYLLWQISYAELFITDTTWPDFGREQLFESIRAFAGRQRRFGALG